MGVGGQDQFGVVSGDRLHPSWKGCAIDVDERWLVGVNAREDVWWEIGDRAAGFDPHVGCGLVLRDARGEHPPGPGGEQDYGCQKAELRCAEIVGVQRAKSSSERDSLVHVL